MDKWRDTKENLSTVLVDSDATLRVVLVAWFEPLDYVMPFERERAEKLADLFLEKLAKELTE